MTQMASETNLPLGIVAGSFAALVGAGIWALVTVLTGYQIGWMAIGVGVLVGWAVRRAGNGPDRSFGFLGASLALIGCALGNLLAACALLASQEGLPFMQILAALDSSLTRDLMAATFTPMDLVFYGIAVYEGYRFSIAPAPQAAPAA